MKAHGALVSLVAAALLGGGCGVGLGGAATFCRPDPSFLPLGAQEDQDLDAVDTAPTVASEEEPSRLPRERRRLGIGPRAGVILPAFADEPAYEPGLLFGVGYELPYWRTETFSWEIAADYSSMSDSSGEVTSSMVIFSASARFAPGGRTFYLAAGGSLLAEWFVDELYGYEGSNVIPMLGAGAGVSTRSRRWDARVTYSVLLGSENVGGFTVLTGGFAF